MIIHTTENPTGGGPAEQKHARVIWGIPLSCLYCIAEPLVYGHIASLWLYGWHWWLGMVWSGVYWILRLGPCRHVRWCWVCWGALWRGFKGRGGLYSPTGVCMVFGGYLDAVVGYCIFALREVVFFHDLVWVRPLGILSGGFSVYIPYCRVYLL